MCMIKYLNYGTITPEVLKASINEEELDGLLRPGCEIDIPLNRGGTITAVCGYAEPQWARFIFKDCAFSSPMNENSGDWTGNWTGYFGSKGRSRVLTEFYPRIDEEWKALIKPRKMAEVLDDAIVKYSDPMWIPSATDLFGASEDDTWEDIDDSFHLPIFGSARDYVKMYRGKLSPYYLRSVYKGYEKLFMMVGIGEQNCGRSCMASIESIDLGIAPGFDIGY